MHWNSVAEKKRISNEVSEVLRQKTGVERIQIMFRINKRVRDDLNRQIRTQFPDWDDSQVLAEINKRLDAMRDSPPYLDDFPDWRELCAGTSEYAKT